MEENSIGDEAPIAIAADLSSFETLTLVDSLPLYNYQPLSGPTNIRVIELLPTTGDREQVECTIKEIDYTVEDEKEYQALSYAWGGDDEVCHAIVRNEDGSASRIPLTTNIAVALRDLRDSEEIKSKILWIDQICINQSGGPEKSLQVAIMGQIYRHASRVITYAKPSEDDEEEKRGIELFHRLDRHFSPNYALMLKPPKLNDLYFSRHKLPVGDIPADLRNQRNNYNQWKWLAGLAFGEWTRRQWIIQEQLLNVETFILRGKRILRWNAVAAMTILFWLGALPWYSGLRYTNETSPEVDEWLAPWDIAESIYVVWKGRAQLNQLRSPSTPSGYVTSSLLDNMWAHQFLGSRDPRDRVYALLSVSNDRILLGINPDYSDENTPRRLFKDVSIRMLQTGHNLEILSHACRWDNDSDPTWISWSINVARHKAVVAISVRWRPDNTASVHPYTKFRYPVRFHSDDNVLVLKGRRLDYMKMALPPVCRSRSMEYEIEDAAYINGWCQVMFNFSTILHEAGITLANIASLARTLRQDTVKSSGLADAHRTDEYQAYQFCCYLRGWIYYRSLGCKRVGIDPTRLESLYHETVKPMAATFMDPDEFESWDPTTRLDQTEENVFYRLDERGLWRGRSFGVSREGRIVSGMNAIEPGDEIFTFQGADDRLFILRPVGDKYRLISDVWVDGLMEGQAYKGLDPEKVDYDVELI